jgi:DNA-binding response OmpR family regulator
VDLILADIAMPKMNGYQLHERVTGDPRWVTIPFVFVTARTMDSDVRYGKALGVDDYLTKPFRGEDLLIAVRGRLRRAQQLKEAFGRSARRPNEGAETLAFGRLRIDLNQHRVWVGRRQIRLSAKEFQLLSCLARKQRQVVPVQELVHATHGLEVGDGEAGALLRPLIRSLRRKLGYRTGQRGCIQNVRGVGYQLIAPRN